MKIYHYTNIEALALILKNQTIRFNRLDKVDDIEEDACVINGRGFAIWDGFKEFQDYYYQSMELFKEYVEANEMSISDFPVDEDLDIVELNKVLEYNFEELKDVYEGE